MSDQLDQDNTLENEYQSVLSDYKKDLIVLAASVLLCQPGTQIHFRVGDSEAAKKTLIDMKNVLDSLRGIFPHIEDINMDESIMIVSIQFGNSVVSSLHPYIK